MSYFTSPQEQEHLDHVAGSASEFQNTYAASSIELVGLASDKSVPIRRAKSLGLFVVVRQDPHYCRHTDAFLHCVDTFICAFPTQEAAKTKAAQLAKKQAEAGLEGESTFLVV